MTGILNPLAQWSALLRRWQALAAFGGVLVYEGYSLFLPEYQLVEQSFDGISGGQLYYDHGIVLLAWIPPSVTMAMIQIFLALSWPERSKGPLRPRLWLWALLVCLTWTSLAGLVLLVDYLGLAWSAGGEEFDFLLAENSAVALLGVVMLPIATWQIGALHSGPPLTIRAVWQVARGHWPVWLFNFALLQAVFVVGGVLVEKVAMALFSGQPLWGYLLTTVFYAFNLVGAVTFQVAAWSRFACANEPFEKVFN